MCKEIIDHVLFFHLVSKLKDFLPFIFFYLLCLRLMKRSRVKLFCEPSSPMLLSLSIKLWVRRIVWGIFIGIWLGIRDGKFLFFFGPCSIGFFPGVILTLLDQHLLAARPPTCYHNWEKWLCSRWIWLAFSTVQWHQTWVQRDYSHIPTLSKQV